MTKNSGDHLQLLVGMLRSFPFTISGYRIEAPIDGLQQLDITLTLGGSSNALSHMLRDTLISGCNVDLAAYHALAAAVAESDDECLSFTEESLQKTERTPIHLEVVDGVYVVTLEERT